MLVKNKIKYLDSRDISLINYSWDTIAPNLYHITIFFYNELYNSNTKNIPSKKVDIDKFSMKALNLLGYMISNLENLNDTSENLKTMLRSIGEFGKLESFKAETLKIAFINAIKKNLGLSWKLDCGIAWLKLATYIEREVMVKSKPKRKAMNMPIWNF